MQNSNIKPVSRSGLSGLLPPLFGNRRGRIREAEEARTNPHLRQALENEKYQGHKISVIARTAALGVVAAMLPFMNPNWDVLYYEFLILAFIILGWAQFRMARVGRSDLELGLIFLDLALLAFTMLMPNPFVTEGWPTAVQYRFEGFGYFYLLLAAGTLAYSWRTVISIGTWVPVIWLAGMGLILFFGRTVPGLTEGMNGVMADFPRLAELFDPNNAGISFRIQEVVIFFLVASILGLKSWRSNQLLLRQARIATERANLARYFPPNLVNDLAAHDEPLGQIRSQDIAVLFADIVGFTRMAETQSPEEVVKLLRRFHALLEDAVFSHDGTLDKYLGDGIMATFGTPNPTGRDASNSLLAARAMHDAVDRWNTERADTGGDAIRLSVGINFGPVILGDIGTERRLEFAALGDTVNVASRLESATRELDSRIVIAASLAERIENEEGRRDLLSNMTAREALQLRGRSQPVNVLAG